MGAFIFFRNTIDFRRNKIKEQGQMNDELRKECKLLKALQDISYKELAEYLEIKTDSFYCWLKGYYELGYSKQRKLLEIINTLKE